MEWIDLDARSVLLLRKPLKVERLEELYLFDGSWYVARGTHPPSDSRDSAKAAVIAELLRRNEEERKALEGL